MRIRRGHRLVKSALKMCIRDSPKALGLQFLDTLRRPDRDNAIDVYLSDEYEDVLREGVWQTKFKVKPEPLTAQEKKEWIATQTGVTAVSYTHLVLAILAAVVLFGGVKRLGAVTEKLVPCMAVVYILACLAIILYNASSLPTVFHAVSYTHLGTHPITPH